MVEDDEEHGHAAEEDGEGVELVVCDHGGGFFGVRMGLGRVGFWGGKWVVWAGRMDGDRRAAREGWFRRDGDICCGGGSYF